MARTAFLYHDGTALPLLYPLQEGASQPPEPTGSNPHARVSSTIIPSCSSGKQAFLVPRALHGSLSVATAICSSTLPSSPIHHSASAPESPINEEP